MSADQGTTRQRSIAKMAEVIARHRYAWCWEDLTVEARLLRITESRPEAVALSLAGCGWAGALSDDDSETCIIGDWPTGSWVDSQALARAFGSGPQERT